MTNQNQILNRAPVTQETIAAIRELIGVTDQAAEASIGEVVSVWRFSHSAGTGTLTAYHEAGRAAIEFGGDSLWGDWDEASQTVTIDDPDDADHRVLYTVYGDRVNAIR